MFDVRLGTTVSVGYLLLPVSATEASAPLLRFRLLFLDLGTERYDRRARSAFDLMHCLLTQPRSAIGT